MWLIAVPLLRPCLNLQLGKQPTRIYSSSILTMAKLTLTQARVLHPPPLTRIHFATMKPGQMPTGQVS